MLSVFYSVLQVENVADKLEKKKTDISSGANAAIYQQSSKASATSRGKRWELEMGE